MLSQSVITLHAQDVGGYGWEVTKMVEAGVRGATFLDSTNLAVALHNALGSDCNIVCRWKAAEEYMKGYWSLLANTPEKFADMAFEHQLTYMQQAPFAYWQFPTDEFADYSLAEQYNAATVRWLQHMTDAKLKGCIFNFPVGNPGDLQIWLKFLPSLHFANDHGHILGLHEYNSPHLDSNDPTYYTLRHRRVWELLDLIHVCPNLKLALTEFGWDQIIINGKANGLTGWKKCVNAAQAEKELFGDNPGGGFNGELKKDPYLLFAAFYRSSNIDKNFDYNLYDSRADYNLSANFFLRIKQDNIPGASMPPVIAPPVVNLPPVTPPTNQGAGLYKVNKDFLRIRSTPIFTGDTNIIGLLVGGMPVYVENIVGDAAKLYGATAYVYAPYLMKTDVPLEEK